MTIRPNQEQWNQSFALCFDRSLHKKVHANQLGTINLTDRKHPTTSQKFVDLYKKYQAQGALDDEKIFEVALEKAQEDVKAARSAPAVTGNEGYSDTPSIESKEQKLDLVKSFKAAQSSPPKPLLGDFLKDDDSK